MSEKEFTEFVIEELIKEEALLTRYKAEPDRYQHLVDRWEDKHGREIGELTEVEYEILISGLRLGTIEVLPHETTSELHDHSDYLMEETSPEQILLMDYMHSLDEYQESLDKWERESSNQIDEHYEFELELLELAHDKMLEEEISWK